jgi:peptidoglycan/xylan/chitin deacetylase (PgdA/CDA1 family)
LEQANFDWLFGCNPWGTSMVYGLPSWGDTPVDPHSSFTHLYKYPINGGLVDGPVYTNIFNSLLGIHLGHEDEYKDFQSNLAVYHDDFGDFSTNEPTMDGTASLIYLLAAKESEAKSKFIKDEGAIIRVQTDKKELALVFTADETGEGLATIINALDKQNIKASFFFTGRFYRNKQFQSYIKQLLKQGDYLGPHSDIHPLYCDWKKRDSLLITKQAFNSDLDKNLQAMHSAGIDTSNVHLFIPPYEWHNKTIADWSNQRGLQLFNFSPGTSSNADYTWPQLPSYKTSETILNSIKRYETDNGLNGFILLVHAGTDVKRTDKFYTHLDELIRWAKEKGYEFKRIDELLK